MDEEPVNIRMEWIKFIAVISILVIIGVGNIFVRQMPLIALRTYDFQKNFVFRNIWHEGEVRFKVCFRQKFMKFYGYNVCHRFPPTRNRYLKDGVYNKEEFTAQFVDPVYMGKFIKKFEDKNRKLGKEFLGFQVVRKPEDLTIIPLTTSPDKKAQSHSLFEGY
ncbi:MAG: hypothetical protein QNL04_07365 [SAR324 cluster bacterium]|nr:hypothetical protein [SAR324 cluster bacterium]